MADSPFMVGNALDSFQQGQLNSQKLQQGDLQNQQLQAQLPGIQGQSQSLAAQGEIDQGSKQEKLDLIKNTALSKMSDNDAKMSTNLGGQIAQFGAMLERVPPPARASAIGQFATKFNLPPDNPIVKSLMEQDPEKLPQMVQEMGTKMVQLGSDYIKQAGQLGIKGQNAAQVAGINAGSRETVAGIRSKNALDVAGLNNASREKLMEFQANLKQQLQDTKAKSPQQLVAARLQQYQDNPTEENRDLLDQANQVAMNLVQNPQLAKLFQDASTAQSVMPGLPNTVPQPNANPVKSFPTGGGGASPSTAPAGVPPGAKQVGTSGGKPVYELNGKRYIIQ